MAMAGGCALKSCQLALMAILIDPKVLEARQRRRAQADWTHRSAKICPVQARRRGKHACAGEKARPVAQRTWRSVALSSTTWRSALHMFACCAVASVFDGQQVKQDPEVW